MAGFGRPAAHHHAARGIIRNLAPCSVLRSADRRETCGDRITLAYQRAEGQDATGKAATLLTFDHHVVNANTYFISRHSYSAVGVAGRGIRLTVRDQPCLWGRAAPWDASIRRRVSGNVAYRGLASETLRALEEQLVRQLTQPRASQPVTWAQDTDTSPRALRLHHHPFTKIAATHRTGRSAPKNLQFRQRSTARRFGREARIRLRAGHAL